MENTILFTIYNDTHLKHEPNVSKRDSHTFFYVCGMNVLGKDLIQLIELEGEDLDGKEQILDQWYLDIKGYLDTYTESDSSGLDRTTAFDKHYLALYKQQKKVVKRHNVAFRHAYYSGALVMLETFLSSCVNQAILDTTDIQYLITQTQLYKDKQIKTGLYTYKEC